MHQSRKNTNEEKELLKINFEVPPIIIILLVLIGLMASIPNFVTNCTIDMYSGDEANFLIAILFEILIVGVLFLIYFILKKILESKVYCITTKRITFTYNIFNIYIKNGSYRFEEIDDVIATDILGLNNIVIKFKQGHLIDTPSIYKKDKKSN